MGRKTQTGFTLIELMIAVAVLAILTIIATSTYLNAQRKGNRGAAEAFLVAVAQQEQQYLIDNRAFLACSAPITSTTCALGLQVPSNVSAFYTVSVSVNNTATPPTFSATAVPLSSTYQASDSAGTLTLDSQGNRLPSGVW